MTSLTPRPTAPSMTAELLGLPEPYPKGQSATVPVRVECDGAIGLRCRCAGLITDGPSPRSSERSEGLVVEGGSHGMSDSTRARARDPHARCGSPGRIPEVEHYSRRQGSFLVPWLLAVPLRRSSPPDESALPYGVRPFAHQGLKGAVGRGASSLPICLLYLSVCTRWSA
jgi:hypothetical protein